MSCVFPGCNRVSEVKVNLSFWRIGEHMEAEYCLEHALEVIPGYLEQAKKGQRMVAKDAPRYVPGE